jgi:hypothetical protein
MWIVPKVLDQPCPQRIRHDVTGQGAEVLLCPDSVVIIPRLPETPTQPVGRNGFHRPHDLREGAAL